MWDMSFGPVFVILSQAASHGKAFEIVLNSFKLRITWLDICHVELWTQHVTTLSHYNCNRARDAAASRVPGMFFCFLFYNSYIFSDYMYTIKNHQRDRRWPSPLLATKETATATVAAAAATTTTGAAAREAEEAGVALIPSYWYFRIRLAAPGMRLRRWQWVLSQSERAFYVFVTNGFFRFFWCIKRTGRAMLSNGDDNGPDTLFGLIEVS